MSETPAATAATGSATLAELKAEGTALFQKQDFAGAAKAYTRALALKTASTPQDEVVALYKNLAACALKQNNADEALKYCDKALELAPGDVKALFRRSQAYEKKGLTDKAFADMGKAAKLDPKNAEVNKEAARLMEIVSKKINYQRTTKGLTETMMEHVMQGKTLAARNEAAHNLVVLAREEPGTTQLFDDGCIDRLVPLLSDPEETVVAHILRVYAGIGASSAKRARVVLAKMSAPEVHKRFSDILMSKSDNLVRAAISVMSSTLEALSSGDNLASSDDKIAAGVVLQNILSLIPRAGITATARDAALSAIVKNAKNKDVSQRFVEQGGVKVLVTTATFAQSPLKPEPEKGALPMSSDTRMNISVALAKVHEAILRNKPCTERFEEDCNSVIVFGDDPNANVPIVYALTTVIQAVHDVGNAILEREGVMDKLMAMAQVENIDTQCAAAEALTHAASDKKRIRGVLSEGFPILKRLYGKDLPTAVRVRALVGLCKMGSIGGGAPNLRTLSEGSNVNLAKKLRGFLLGQDASQDARKWAAEGLAYLTLDAEVKEYIIDDDEILKTIHDLCITADKSVQFSLSNMLVNITNSYDKPTPSEEQEQLKKLGKYAGEHIPEPHPKDKDEAVARRSRKLLDMKFVEALIPMAKSDSEKTKEQVSRVFLALVEKPENRGLVLAQGGAKNLLPLTRDNTDVGTLRAAQALAKIAITTDPSIAFPGQRAAELVRPFVRLLKERNGLLQFEGAMALCNLASMNDEVRGRIMKEKGGDRLVDLMFDEDPLVRRAGTEALVNLIALPEAFDMFATKEGTHWERLKLWVLLAGVYDEDVATSSAAAGGLANLSAAPEVCKRIQEEKQGYTILKELLVHPVTDLQLRALHIVRNISVASTELAQSLAKDDIVSLVSLLFQTTKDERIKNYCSDIFDSLMEKKVLFNHEDAVKRAWELKSKLEAEIVEKMKVADEERAAQEAERREAEEKIEEISHKSQFGKRNLLEEEDATEPVPEDEFDWSEFQPGKIEEIKDEKQ